MNKKEFRKKYLDVRKNITDKLEKSFTIQNKLLEILKPYKVIGVYVSMKDEVSTDELINNLLHQSKIVVVPKVEGKEIKFYQIESLDELKPQGKYQIREPYNQKLFLDNIDTIVVPGICFDKKNNRLGYGGGYFDRYLKDKNIYKIGICFEEQITDELSINENDIKMNAVITD